MDLSRIFTSNPLNLLLTEARLQRKKLAMHITGIDFRQAIQTMDEYETDQKKNIRQKYSRSNQDIFTRLHRPIDKVFTASGGSITINLPEAKQKEFNLYCQNIRKSMSLRKWVQMIALPAYHIDPNGLIFIEVDEDGKPYPTYKSTDDIFYYDADGREIEMVIFKLTARQAEAYGLQVPNSSAVIDRMKSLVNTSGKYYRVVDDVTDKIVIWDGKDVTEIPELNLPNLFGQCPGIIVSDIYQFNSDLLLSPDSEVVELADDYLTDSSTFNNWKKLFMFPKNWRIKSECPTCMGNGVVNGQTCVDCNGTKYQKKSRVRDEIIVPMPDSADGTGKISFPTKWSGQDSPDPAPWELMRDEMSVLYQFMFETKWGYTPQNKPQVEAKKGDKTATQVLDESNNKSQGLYAYSEWAEVIEKFVIDMCAGLMYGSLYKGCSVNYGDRYIMEGPDEIWIKYKDARSSGGSQAILDSLLQDYYESKYYGNPIALQIALKQMRVEPWVHLTLRETQGLSATDLDKACKMYFSEWASTLNDMDWIQGSDDVLRESLIAYSQPKVDIIVQAAADAAAQAAFEPPAAKPALSKPIQ